MEQAALDRIAADYDPSDAAAEFDYHLKQLIIERMREWLVTGPTLELGCSTGESTALLAAHVGELVVVEAAAHNIEAAQTRVPRARFVHSMFEDYDPGQQRFANIVAQSVLEHVADPVQLLARCRGWLAPRGCIHVVVPNGRSLHRLVGAELGILASPLDFSDSDRRLGHRRVYTLEALRRDVKAAGLAISHQTGILLKLLSGRQMLDWSPQLIRALDQVARQHLPQHAAELYVVLRPRRSN